MEDFTEPTAAWQGNVGQSTTVPGAHAALRLREG